MGNAPITAPATPATPEYLELCKKKMFLASNAFFGDKKLEIFSEFKHKIERTHGASIGGRGRTHLKGFPEGKPIGAGQIIQTEELYLENEMK